jgi:hypothetical protein
LNEANPSTRRPYFVPHATFPLFWDGEVPPYADLRRKSKPLLEDAQLNLLTVNALWLSHEFVDLVHEGTPKIRFMGTRVSGQVAVGLKPRLGTFGVSIAFIFRGTLRSYRLTFCRLVTEESLALVLKRLTYFRGNEFAKMLKIFVSATLYVDEQRINHKSLLLFTLPLTCSTQTVAHIRS